MTLDRFQPPTAADDVANCQNCGEAFHYEELSETGLCNQCQPEDNEDDANPSLFTIISKDLKPSRD